MKVFSTSNQFAGLKHCYNMARRSEPMTSPPAFENIYYHPSGNYLHFHHRVEDPFRLTGKANGVKATISPSNLDNDIGEIQINHQYRNNRGFTEQHLHQIKNRLNSLPSDYPDNFFRDEPIHLHVYSHRDTPNERFPQRNPGNIHVINAQHISEPLSPDTLHGLNSYIIKELADAAAHKIMRTHSNWFRNTNPHGETEHDLDVHNRISSLLQGIHHEYNNLPADIRPRDLEEYLIHKINATDDQVERRHLTGLRNALYDIPLAERINQAINEQARIPEERIYNKPPEPLKGEEIDLNDLKNSIFGDMSPEEKGQINKPRIDGEGKIIE